MRAPISLLYCIDQKWQLGHVAAEIALRFYLTIGFAALLLLGVLAATSTDGWQKRLGRRWKRLHRLVFVLLPLALFHYFLQSKSDVTDAVFVTGLACWLVLWRLAPKRWQGRACCCCRRWRCWPVWRPPASRRPGTGSPPACGPGLCCRPICPSISAPARRWR